MAEQDNRNRSDRPLENDLSRELDTPWDVEAFLQQLREIGALVEDRP